MLFRTASVSLAHAHSGETLAVRKSIEEGYSRKSVARPRKARKPITSVTVVRNTVEDTAGSTPNFCRPIGIRVPASDAATQIADHRRADHRAEPPVVVPEHHRRRP